jgi:hypothetical protein
MKEQRYSFSQPRKLMDVKKVKDRVTLPMASITGMPCQGWVVKSMKLKEENFR